MPQALKRSNAGAYLKQEKEEQECWEEAPPGSAGVPPACTTVACCSVSLGWGTRHPAGGNGMGGAEAESRRRCRSTRVEEMGEAVPGRLRAGRPRSRGASFRDVVAAREVHRYFRPCVVGLQHRSAVSSSNNLSQKPSRQATADAEGGWSPGCQLVPGQKSGKQRRNLVHFQEGGSRDRLQVLEVPA